MHKWHAGDHGCRFMSRSVRADVASHVQQHVRLLATIKSLERPDGVDVSGVLHDTDASTEYITATHANAGCVHDGPEC